MNKPLLQELDTAERKAIDSLARYKFQMFGYWGSDLGTPESHLWRKTA